jgi:hypothetical protein
MVMTDKLKVVSKSEMPSFVKHGLESAGPWTLGRIGGSDFEAAAYSYLLKGRFFSSPRLAIQSRGNSIIHQSRCRQLNGYFGPLKSKVYEKYLMTLHESWLDSSALLYAGAPLVEHFESASKKWFSPYADQLSTSVRTGSYSFIESVYPFLSVLSELRPGLTLLVVSPFSRSVVHQHKSALPLVRNFTYPPFALTTVQVPVTYSSLVRRHPVQGDWFGQLEILKERVSKSVFDIALISAGSYSMPLLSHIKSEGKKGIYVGGMLNVFFNLSGQRYEQPQYAQYSVEETKLDPFEASEILKSAKGGRTRNLEALLAYLPRQTK